MVCKLRLRHTTACELALLSAMARAPALAVVTTLAFLAMGLSYLSSLVFQDSLQAPHPKEKRNAFEAINATCADGSETDPRSISACDMSQGKWVFDDAGNLPLYTENCPFHRNAWNCGKNRRPHLYEMNKWRWSPRGCTLRELNPDKFLARIKDMKLGFIGDSLNENMLVSMLCLLWTADPGGRRWKKRKAWRGGYFPKYNVTVAYHRAVLLADYHEWKATDPNGALEKLGFKQGYQVNIDVPAADWINVTQFYNVLIFNTGHWWGFDKFPADNPLLFFKHGQPIIPPLDMKDGLEAVLESMVSYTEDMVPRQTLKLWRMQSPRHFAGGEWNQNGSCLSNTLLSEDQLEDWFGVGRGNVNGEAREMNAVIASALEGSRFEVLNISHMSEFRRDAHPAIWLGQKDAHIKWGQDCLHWCLPGVPDTWVNVLQEQILEYLDTSSATDMAIQHRTIDCFSL